ncbi:amidase [Pseudaestuariivita atlantica]|uniref:Amidase n=2 Tax=Pseudaestuariivita atlantica TaxID=1317121 RepID=A0A0L1JVD7_9RHOB|nr:amidase [Pseudaestuariivita atlantica]
MLLADIAARLSSAATPEAVMEATLAQIRAVNGEVNALVSLRSEADLLAEARGAREGPLAGVPVAIKDLANAEGLPTSMGSPLFAGQVAVEDDLFVARMRAAGAIVIGKSNTPEFGLGSHTVNPVHGATRNAYDPALSAGGSSGGAAVALATGMLEIADGSDMMGSLRNPAGWANVYGMRPTFGLVPGARKGDTFLNMLATNGPMARSPKGLAQLLEVQAGPDPMQPHGRGLFRAEDVEPRTGRIGWLGDWGGAYPMEAGVLATCEAALDEMRRAGFEVVEMAAPFDAGALWRSWICLRSWAVAGALGPLYDDPEMRAALKPAAIWEIERGRALSAAEVHAASVIRSDWFARAAGLFDEVDALALPTAQCWPFDVDLVHPTGIAGVAMDTYHRWMEVVIPASLIGLPAIAVPAGFGTNGLPVGLQLVGRQGSDAALIGMAEMWHRATGWPDARPPEMPSAQGA